MILFPFRTDAVFRHSPWTNLALIAIATLVHVLIRVDFFAEETLLAMILRDWSLRGLIGHAFVHADWWHLIGNMLFLWVFGNAVCTKIGNFAFAVLYLGCILLAASAHLLWDGSPAIGASGAVNGILGFYFALYPTNFIYFIFFYWFGYSSFRVPGIVVILLWFALDLFGVFSAADKIAYTAHLGGFLGGFTIGLLLTLLRVIRMSEDEATAFVKLIGIQRD